MRAGEATASRLRGRVMVTSGVLAAAVVSVLARVHPATAVAVAALFSGLLAVVTGVVVLVTSSRRRDGMRLSSRFLSVGMVVWGVGQLVIGGEASIGDPVFPSLGDLLGTVSAPLGVTGLLLALRPRSVRTHWMRMTLDSLLIGCAAGLMLWRVAYRPALLADGLGAGDGLALAIALIETTILALLLLAWLREFDRGLLLTMLGFAVYAAADGYTLRSVAQGRLWPWVAAALWCVAWPAIGEGVLRLQPARHADDGRAPEARVAFATTLITLVVLVVAVVAFAADPVTDVVTMTFAVAIIVVFAVREAWTGAQRARLMRSLTRQAMQDPLTGLGNRRALGWRLAELTDAAEGAVLTLDLDGFKEVNDLLGHARGDDLLVAVADCVHAALEPDCRAFRVGGDEFVVVVPGGGGRERLLARTLLAEVRSAASTVPGTAAVGVSTSIGVARWSGGAATEAVVESGVALHAAKQSGRDRVESYDGPVAAQHRRSMDVERRLKAAVRAGDVDVHYQPVLRLTTDAVVGFEALARWVDPLLGRVTPDEFIPAAERSGLIADLGTHVLRRALADLAVLERSVPGARVAVNVSPGQLRSPTFAADVVALLETAGVDPTRLIIEVTESAFVGEDATELGQLQQLREHGVWVAIDDFGSGYSALAYLSRLPASTLKLDQGLTANLTTDPRALAVMRSIIELGRALPLEVVVEGIETTEVRDVVRDLGACYAQGWLYAPAVPLEQVADTVREIEIQRLAPIEGGLR
ncbi:MAG: putative bifunctional diguanylate cyclase/phosphodiesterase [Angustibacter sp.]